METIQALLKSNSHHDRLLGFRCLFKNYSKEDIKSRIFSQLSSLSSYYDYYFSAPTAINYKLRILLKIKMIPNQNATVVQLFWYCGTGFKNDNYNINYYSLLNRGIYKHEYPEYKSDIINRLTDILYHDILLND